MSTLRLTLKKKWFDMIASGEKKEEYREIKPYWIKRFIWNNDSDNISNEQIINQLNNPKTNDYFDTEWVEIRWDFSRVEFRNGYSKNAPKITLRCEGIDVGFAKPEWSDNWQGKVFIIKLGEIINENRI